MNITTNALNPSQAFSITEWGAWGLKSTASNFLLLSAIEAGGQAIRHGVTAFKSHNPEEAAKAKEDAIHELIHSVSWAVIGSGGEIFKQVGLSSLSEWTHSISNYLPVEASTLMVIGIALNEAYWQQKKQSGEPIKTLADRYAIFQLTEKATQPLGRKLRSASESIAPLGQTTWNMVKNIATSPAGGPLITAFSAVSLGKWIGNHVIRQFSG